MNTMKKLNMNIKYCFNITKLLLLFMVLGMVTGARSQNSMDLTFRAFNNSTHVQLDSIKIMNRTQGGDTVLYWPDTILSMIYEGIFENSDSPGGFRVLQNYPNPVTDQTKVTIYVPARDKVSITVTDILGRMLIQSEPMLDRGKHTFRFTPGNGDLCLFTARWRGQNSSITILQSGLQPGGPGTLEYTGSEAFPPQLKALKDIRNFSYSPGNELLCAGYTGTFQSGMSSFPVGSTTYDFQFATGIPCPGTPTVEYEGQVYNTIQVFSQCWLKENLNVGTMVILGQMQTDNGIREKYCYDNSPDSCSKYGGLYQWDEMMQYTIQQGTRGICPSGWHVPTSEEWKILEGSVDSQCGIGHPIWDDYYHWRGSDVGSNLKTTSSWIENGNGNDRFVFSGLPAGESTDDGYFYFASINTTWWTSTEFDFLNTAWIRNIAYNHSNSAMYAINKANGFSVRCLRDY
jgi:uncharacterized protein (TIGR02145 family)